MSVISLSTFLAFASAYAKKNITHKREKDKKDKKDS